jgi:hypothetical protein
MRECRGIFIDRGSNRPGLLGRAELHRLDREFVAGEQAVSPLFLRVVKLRHQKHLFCSSKIGMTVV